MVYTDLTRKALCISFEAHKNQKDKSGVPYVYHPYEVASHLEDEYEVCTALLHDVIEDTEMTLEDLEKNFPKEVIDALKLLTHDKSVPYFEYIDKIKTNPIAKAVKQADLQHNSNLTRNKVVTQKDMIRYKKYKRALEILNK